MTHQIHEIMTQQLHSIRSEATLLEVARFMRDRQIGTVLVTSRDGTLRGIVTGRDIVVRAMAEARPLDRTQAWEICSNDLVKVAPTMSIEATKRLMRDRALRRVPVVANGVGGDRVAGRPRAAGPAERADLTDQRDPRGRLKA